MARKFLDATGNYSDPATSGLKTLNADGGDWGAPVNGLKALDAAGEWTAPVVGTPAGELAEGTLIKLGSIWDEPIIWRVIGHNLAGMPEGSITLITDKIIAILPFDAKEKYDVDKSHNRDKYGNNDYGVSNIRQWLNSSASAGNWYSPQHELDMPPSVENVGENSYDTLAGFLNPWSQAEQKLLLETERYYGAIIGNGNENTTHCTDKVFLITTTESGTYQYLSDGTTIPGFVDKYIKTTCTEACINHSNSQNNPSSPSENFGYWLATGQGEWVSVTSTNPLGDSGIFLIHQTYAYRGTNGVRPACNIPDTAILPNDSLVQS